MTLKIRKTLLGLMELNSIIIIFMSIVQLGAFDIKGKMALALWCGVSSLLGNCFAEEDKNPCVFPAVMGLVNVFILIFAQWGLDGGAVAFAVGVLCACMAVKIRKASIRNIK